MIRILGGSTHGLPDAEAFLDTLDVLAERGGLLDGFFRREADVFVARAPGRLDVMGGIADYSGSLVLELPLAEATFAAVLGVSGPTISRLARGSYQLQPSRRREWEFALLFVRLYRSLAALVGTDADARTWLRSENLALGARPLDLIEGAEGMVRVLHYLDASRGRG